jgi:hypothetical protein
MVGDCEVTADKRNAGRSSVQFFLTRRDTVIIIIIIIIIIINCYIGHCTHTSESADVEVH